MARSTVAKETFLGSSACRHFLFRVLQIRLSHDVFMPPRDGLDPLVRKHGLSHNIVIYQKEVIKCWNK